MEEELLILHRQNDSEKLKNYVQGLDVNELCSKLKKICTKEDGSFILHILFKGLSNSVKCQEKRIKIITEILDTIQNKTLSSKLSNKLITLLAAEVDVLSTSHLIKLVSCCLQILQNFQDGDESVCWKDLLPTLLHIIIEKNTIEHNGTTMTGSEFKSEIVTAICVIEWQNHMVISMAAMFNDIPLTPEEHIKVVNKLCKAIHKLKLDEIPPLVHQILELTKQRNSMPLFVALAEFFETNLYNNIGIDNDIAISQIIPEGGLPLKELQIVEGTILYHLSNGLSSGPPNVKEFLKVLQNCLHEPHFVLHPFFVTLLLCVSSISYNFEQQVSNILKAAILRSLLEEEKLSESAWLEWVIPTKFSVHNVLTKITQNCYRDRDRILKGLVNLAFLLLDVPKTRGKDSQCEKIWNLGTDLLVKLIQKYPHITETVFQSLVNQISQIHESTQYTDCLSKIASRRPLSLLDCSSVIMQLLENVCVRLPGIIGQRVVAAILPLMKMSQSLRDNLIVFLRKSLFSERAAKEIAVYGFLELLKDLKISDVRSLSQSISQNYVGITQIYSGTCATMGAVSNEGMCLEILSILRQVFDYHYKVKLVLYKGVYDCFYANPKIGTHILDNLISRLDKFHRESETPPLDFQSAVVCQDSSIVIQEPISHLIFAIALIAAKTEDEDAGKSKFNEVLDSMCEKMSDSDIPHFGFEKEPVADAFEGFHENELKHERIRQILGVYEALMCHLLCTWKDDAIEHGRKLNSLFKGFSRMSDYAKNLGKVDKKKIDNKKASQKGETKGKEKFPVFKPPNTVLNLKCASRLLALLNGSPVQWASEESRELIRGKRDLHRYALNVALELVSQTRLLSPSELSRSKYMLQYVSHIGRVLYLRCISRLSEVKSFDGQCAVLALECFSEVLNLVCFHFKPKLSVFLTEMGIPKDDLRGQLKTILDEILTQLKSILLDESDDAEGKEDLQIKKTSLLLVSVASYLINQLPRGGPQLSQVFTTIKSICKETGVKSPNVAKALLSLLLTTYIKNKPSGGMLLDVVLCLCDSMPLIDDEMSIDKHDNYAIVNKKTAHCCLSSVCEAVHYMIAEVEWMVSRFKSELSLLSYPMEESTETRKENLDEREREMCRHLNFCIKILSTMCTIAVPPGTLSDQVLKEVANVYNRLVLVTRYYILKVTKYHQTFQNTRFEKTVKLADHELAKNMYCFTEHIISDGAASNEEPQLKKQKDAAALRNKVLKETKMIPKVIYEKEQFQKFVMLLAAKAKIDLEIKHTMARDYRLYAKQVKEIIEKENVNYEELPMDVDDTSQPESTQASKRARTQE